MTSLTGATGISGGSSGGSRMRGLAPGMKHIPGHHRFQQFTPEQMNLFQQMFGQVGPESYLSRLAGGDEEMFNQIEAPALRQFGALQGNIASRFSGMGMGARKSSGFQNEMGAAGANFAERLQAQRMGLQRQAIMDLMGLSQNLLGQRPYDVQEAAASKPSGWGALAGTALGGLGGFALGGPSGGMMGAQLGYGIGSKF